jgi:hypothetical protein
MNTIEPFAITIADFEHCKSGPETGLGTFIYNFRETQYFKFLPPFHVFVHEDGFDFPENSDPLSVSIFMEYKKCDDPATNLFPKLLPIILKAIEDGNYEALRQLTSWVYYDSFPPLDASVNLAIMPFLESGNCDHVRLVYSLLSHLKNFESNVYIPIAVHHLQTQPELFQANVSFFLKNKTIENVGEYLEPIRQALLRKTTTYRTRNDLRHFM